MKKLCLFFIAFTALFFAGCAGAGSGAGEGDVGYLSLGTQRAGLAAFGFTAADLQTLTLEGTLNGETETLATWTTGSDTAGKTIPIQPGNWSFTLKAHGEQAAGTQRYFLAQTNAEIIRGKTTTVAFHMKYLGKPVSLANTGDIIFTNGYCETYTSSYISDLISENTVESVAVVVSGDIYGITTQDDTATYQNPTDGIPSGWLAPPLNVLQQVRTDRTTIGDALVACGSTAYFTSKTYWSSTPGSSGAYKTYIFSSGSVNINAYINFGLYYYHMNVKKYN